MGGLKIFHPASLAVREYYYSELRGPNSIAAVFRPTPRITENPLSDKTCHPHSEYRPLSLRLVALPALTHLLYLTDRSMAYYPARTRRLVVVDNGTTDEALTAIPSISRWVNINSAVAGLVGTRRRVLFIGAEGEVNGSEIKRTNRS